MSRRLCQWHVNSWVSAWPGLPDLASRHEGDQLNLKIGWVIFLVWISFKYHLRPAYSLELHIISLKIHWVPCIAFDSLSHTTQLATVPDYTQKITPKWKDWTKGRGTQGVVGRSQETKAEKTSFTKELRKTLGPGVWKLHTGTEGLRAACVRWLGQLRRDWGVGQW